MGIAVAKMDGTNSILIVPPPPSLRADPPTPLNDLDSDPKWLRIALRSSALNNLRTVPRGAPGHRAHGAPPVPPRCPPHALIY